MSEFSVFKSCADNYYYTRQARFHHSQRIAIFEFTYIKWFIDNSFHKIVYYLLGNIFYSWKKITITHILRIILNAFSLVRMNILFSYAFIFDCIV